jgi:Holliday junction resolvase
LDSKQSRANKRKGSGWEVELVEYFRDQGLVAERLRLSGTNDEGDLWFFKNKKFIIVEAKNTKGFLPGQWMKEAVLEAQNWLKKRKSSGPAIPIVIAKRRQHNVGKAFVIIELDTFMEVME